MQINLKDDCKYAQGNDVEQCKFTIFLIKVSLAIVYLLQFDKKIAVMDVMFSFFKIDLLTKPLGNESLLHEHEC